MSPSSVAMIFGRASRCSPAAISGPMAAKATRSGIGHGLAPLLGRITATTTSAAISAADTVYTTARVLVGRNVTGRAGGEAGTGRP